MCYYGYYYKLILIIDKKENKYLYICESED